jgi:double-stranded uracil-DNA glycosylase
MRPTRPELAAAAGRTIPDIIAPGLPVVFCGINPGLYSAATGHHFARPGNRFWPALHRSGFTPRQLVPSEESELLTYGLGITNLVARATARADELTPAELRDGGRALESKAVALRPAWLAVVGVTAYRVAFARPQATVGSQSDRLGPARVWVLPNPSGLNAHYTVDSLAAEFARLRQAAQRVASGGRDDLDLDQPVTGERLGHDRRRWHEPTP